MVAGSPWSTWLPQAGFATSCGRPPAWPHTCVARPPARPLTCVAADVNPQRPAAGEPLAAVRAGLLLLSCVRLGGAGVEET